MKKFAIGSLWLMLLVSLALSQSPAAREPYESGVALRARQDLQGALAAFTRAVQADPSFSEAWRQRALVYIDLQRLKEAMADFDRAIQADPRNARAYVGRAYVKGAQNDRAGAIADCTLAIEIDPNYSNAYLNRGSNRNDSGDLQGALADFDRAIQTNPGNALALYNRGVLKANVKDMAGAREDFSRSLEIEPNHSYASQARQYLAQLPAAPAAGRNQPPTPTPPPVTPPPVTPPAVTSPPATPPSADTVTPTTTAPFADALLNIKNFKDETTWKLKDTLWQKSTTPLPNLQPKIIAADPSPPLDFNRITPAHYSAAITAAKEGMRLLAGEMTADQQKLFDAKWAPYFDYPCQEVIAYLNKFNPLMSQFLGVRSAAAAAAMAYDGAQLDLLTALDNSSPDDVVEAMEILSRQRTVMNSLAAEMNTIARKIEALGEMPNPLELKGRARRAHDEALDWLDPAPFEGLWRGPEAKMHFYKVLSRYPDGKMLVYYLPVTDADVTRSNAQVFLADRLGVIEKASGGSYIHLDWPLYKFIHVLRPAGRQMRVGVFAPGDTADASPEFTESDWIFSEKEPKLIPVPASRPWAEVTKVAADQAARKLEQYLRWRKSNPEEFEQALAGPQSAALLARRFEAGMQEIRRVVEQRRGADMAQMEANLDAMEWKARMDAATTGTVKKVDREAERKKRTAQVDADAKAMEAKLAEELKVKLGMAAPSTPKPAAPGPDEEALKRAQAEQEVIKQRIALIEANIKYFEGRMAETQLQIASAADDRSREQLQWNIMVLERNLQDERDQLTTLRTGQWTRTRTTFDSYCAELESEHSRKVADDWNMLNRMLTRIERQIANADPADRDRLRQFWLNRVTPEVIARQDFDAVREAAAQIFKESQKNLNEEIAQAEKDLAWEETKVAFAETTKATVDYTMIACSIAAGPAGDLVYAFYNATTGYIEGGFAEAFKRPVVNYYGAVRVADAAINGYTEGVVENILKNAQNPDAVKLDETGAGLAGALWAGGKQAAFEVGVRVAIAAVGRMIGGEGTVPEGRKPPTAQQLINESKFRLKQAQGRELVNDFIEKSRALDKAAKSGASKDTLAKLRAEADQAYKAIKGDYHAKSYLKSFTRNNKQVVQSYNAIDRVQMQLFKDQVTAEMSRRGYTAQKTRLFSNSASKGGIGMDVDLGFDEPARFLGSGAKRIPNPEYQVWLDGLRRRDAEFGIRYNVSPRAFQEEAKRVMRDQFRKQFGQPPDEAFLNFTHSGHAEAYKNIAWIGSAGQKTANFPVLHTQGPAYAQQAGDVTRFKVNELAHGHPSLDTYSLFQEQCRGMVKDMNTKLMGATPGAPINPAAPLASAPRQVQQHFIQLRKVMDDFANNRIGPIEAERLINQLTGGRGMAEVADRFQIVLQGGLAR